MAKKKVVQKSKKKRPRKKNKFGKFKVFFLLALMLFIVCGIYGRYKPLPGGISKWYERSKTNDVKLLIDNSYEQNGSMMYDHEIFQEILNTINEADDFIIVDMFLFNDLYDGKTEFPKLSSQLTDALVAKKQLNPDLKVYMLTDPINSFYGSYTPEHYKKLRENDVYLYETDLVKLRDSNPIYSAFWRPTLRWFGNSENGLITNIFSKDAPDVTVRGFGRLLNMKANHRKTIVTEDYAIVSSSNPHDPSGHHQNVALKMSGQIQEDIINSEVHAINMSGGHLETSDFKINNRKFDNTMDYETTLVTEGKIRDAVIEQIEKADDNDTIKIGMFYLSDRKVISALVKAAERGVNIKLILDVNKEAFGKEKPGIPNKPVAHELLSRSNDRIQVRWAVSHGEQYHAKFMLFEYKDEGTSSLILGSANMTRRNIQDLNMESDAIVSGKSELPVFRRMDKDFDAKWNNEYAHVTDSYEKHKDVKFWKTVLYRLQEFTGLSSF